MKFATLLLLALLLGRLAAAQPGQVLSLSDIHFTPSNSLAQGDSLFQRLVRTPVRRWKRILDSTQKDTTVGPPTLNSGNDTDYWLFCQLLRALPQACPKPQYIIITGDVIGHNLTRGQFAPAQPGVTSAAPAVDTLLRKVHRFVADTLSALYPGVPILAGLGNNDTDMGDEYPPSPAFLAALAQVWVPKQRHPNPAQALQTFRRGGYYAYPLGSPGSGQKLLMLNSVAFMPGLNARAGSITSAQLAWLAGELAAQPASSRLWLAMHMPYGLDAYQSAGGYRGTPATCSQNPPPAIPSTPMWRELPNLADSLFAPLHAYVQQHPQGFALGLAGHTHMDEFRLHADPASKQAEHFLHVTPAVSPIFGNNPGFQVLTCDPLTLSLLNSTTYYLPLLQQQAKAQWTSDCSFRGLICRA